MIQAAVGAVLKELLGGITEQFPKPPLGGEIRVAVIFVIKDGKPALKEGSEIEMSLHLSLGDE